MLLDDAMRAAAVGTLRAELCELSTVEQTK
jgi:hypothetical protein